MEVLAACGQQDVKAVHVPSPTVTPQKSTPYPAIEGIPLSDNRRKGQKLESLVLRVISEEPLQDAYSKDGINLIKLTSKYLLKIDPFQIPGYAEQCGVPAAGAKPINFYFIDNQTQEFPLETAVTPAPINLDDIVQASLISLNTNFEISSNPEDRKRALKNLVNLNLNSTVANMLCIRALMGSFSYGNLTTEQLQAINEQGIRAGRQVLEEILAGRTRLLLEVEQLTLPSLN